MNELMSETTKDIEGFVLGFSKRKKNHQNKIHEEDKKNIVTISTKI